MIKLHCIVTSTIGRVIDFILKDSKLMATASDVADKAGAILTKVQAIGVGLTEAGNSLSTLDTKLDEIRTFIEGLGGTVDQTKIDEALNSLTAAEGVVDGLITSVTDLSEKAQARVAEADALDE